MEIVSTLCGHETVCPLIPESMNDKLTNRTAAEYVASQYGMQISEATVRTWIHRGLAGQQLPVEKPDGWHMRIDPNDIERLIAGQAASK